MSNARTIEKTLNSDERYVRLTVTSPSGPYVVPGKGQILPNLIPANLIGLCFMDTFDMHNRQIRTRIPIQLNGSNAQVDAKQSAESEQAAPVSKAHEKLLGLLTAKPQESATAAPVQSSTATPSLASPTPPPPPSSPPPTVLKSLPAPPPVPSGVDAGPSLAHEVTTAQATQLRSYVMQTEAATDSALELEKLTIINNAQYTRELGEWQQMSSVFRKELYAAQSGYAEKALRHFDAIDYAANRLLRMSDEVARRVKDPLFQPAPPPPPPPPPPPDLAGVAISFINMISTVAGAVAGKGQLPSPKQQDVVLNLLSKGAASGARGLSQVLADAELGNPGSDTTSASAMEHFAQAHTRKPVQTAKAEQVTIAKDDLLRLAEQSILGFWGDSERLAELIRSDQLSEVVLTIPPPQHGIYSIHRNRLVQLVESGALTLFGFSGAEALKMFESGDLTSLIQGFRK